MKIKLHSISPLDGLDVSFTLNLLDQSTSKETFIHPAKCQAHLEISKNDVFLNGNIEFDFSCHCYRCDKEIEKNERVQFFLTLAPKTQDMRKTDFHQESQEGLAYFERGEIKLDEIFKEQIFLSLPMRYLCKDDCKGLCMHCREDLNFGEHQCKRPINQTL